MEQAVDKTNPDHKGEGAVALDEALKEFDEKTGKVEQPVVTPDDLEYIRTRRAQDESEARQKDLTAAIKAVSEGVNHDLPDWAIRGYMESLAEKDQKFAEAWNDRHAKPDAWNETLKGINAKLKEELSIDRKVSRDTATLESAVRSASTHTIDKPVDVSKMSDTEFAVYKAGL